MESIPEIGFPVTREDISLGQGYWRSIRYAYDKVKVQIYFRTKEIPIHPHSGKTIALTTDITYNVSDLNELILWEWTTDAVSNAINDPNFDMPLRIEINGVTLEDGDDIPPKIMSSTKCSNKFIWDQERKLSARALFMGMGLAVAQSV